MEYYFLILNRTFLVILRQRTIYIGIQGNGLVSVEGGKRHSYSTNHHQYVKSRATRQIHIPI